MFNANQTPASRYDFFASPTPQARPPRTYNIASPTPPTRPARTYNTAGPITPTPPPRKYNTPNPTTPTLPPRKYNTPSLITPTPPSRRYNTKSTATPTPAPRRNNTPSAITPTPPARSNYTVTLTATPPPRKNFTPPTKAPSADNTANMTTPTRPPRANMTASPAVRVPPAIPEINPSPVIRYRPPIPDITASPPIIRFRPPIPDIPANPPIRFRPSIPDNTASPPIRFRPSIPDITATPPIRFRSPIPVSSASPTIPSRTPATRNQATLNVSPSPPVEVGNPVLFEVVLWQPPPPGWNLQYRFDFGDGTRTDWVSERQATHTYLSPRSGGYPVLVEILTTRRDGAQSTKNVDGNVEVVAPLKPAPTSTATSAPITPSPTPVTPSPTPSTSPPASPTATPLGPAPQVYLSVDKNSTFAGDPVTFSISTNLPADNQPHSYSIDFGDGSKPSVIKVSTVSHVFKTAGNYTAWVTVLDHRLNVRGDVAISVDKPRSVRFWIYILAGLAVVVLASLIYTKCKPKPATGGPITFYPYSDWDAPQNPPKNFAIKYGLYFHSNVSAGQDRLETNGASSILKQ